MWPRLPNPYDAAGNSCRYIICSHLSSCEGCAARIRREDGRCPLRRCLIRMMQPATHAVIICAHLVVRDVLEEYGVNMAGGMCKMADAKRYLVAIINTANGALIYNGRATAAA
ncbi:hypothetical protein U1Q18_050074 [Sarracenia purpurea var. burkii]